ncbi:MAG: hypothetical protein IKG22_06555 [Atopobiaceae bacterium]|nr:hypothetical protein [Atopobiaceae bacterium]
MAERPKNYLRASGRLPWRVWYFYLDKEPWLADRIFIRHELKVHFKGHYVSEGWPYAIVSVWVPTGETDLFERCMDELYASSLLHGRDDYPAACSASPLVGHA